MFSFKLRKKKDKYSISISKRITITSSLEEQPFTDISYMTYNFSECRPSSPKNHSTWTRLQFGHTAGHCKFNQFFSQNLTSRRFWNRIDKSNSSYFLVWCNLFGDKVHHFKLAETTSRFSHYKSHGNLSCFFIRIPVSTLQMGRRELVE